MASFCFQQVCGQAACTSEQAAWQYYPLLFQDSVREDCFLPCQTIPTSLHR